MKVVFMGTPEFSVPCLERLVSDGHDVAAVYTQPDKPKGRGYTLQPPPVKVYATEQGLPVYQPNTLRGEEFANLLEELSPDLIIVVAYGKILPVNVLEYPKYGCINVHASLLPKYRGAAPIQRVIIEGEKESGVTIQQMNEGIDTGDILMVREYKVEPKETGGSLFDKLEKIWDEYDVYTKR